MRAEHLTSKLILFSFLIITLQLPLALSYPKQICKQNKNEPTLMTESKFQEAGKKRMAKHA